MHTCVCACVCQKRNSFDLHNIAVIRIQSGSY